MKYKKIVCSLCAITVTLGVSAYFIPGFAQGRSEAPRMGGRQGVTGHLFMSPSQNQQSPLVTDSQTVKLSQGPKDLLVDSSQSVGPSLPTGSQAGYGRAPTGYGLAPSPTGYNDPLQPGRGQDFQRSLGQQSVTGSSEGNWSGYPFALQQQSVGYPVESQVGYGRAPDGGYSSIRTWAGDGQPDFGGNAYMREGVHTEEVMTEPSEGLEMLDAPNW